MASPNNSSSTTATHRPLYGGALSFSLPSRFSDVSPWRDVPDHQEVFADPDTDQSVIVEINQQLPCNDEDAGKEHMGELAEASSSHDLTIVSSRVLPSSALPLLTQPASFTGLVVGEMRTSKYREDESKANRVRVLMLMMRLRDYATDVLIILNAPLQWGEGSATQGRPIPSEQENEAVMQQIASTIRINDYGLFGPREAKMAE